MKKYRTLLLDPPWQQETITGFTHPRNRRPDKLPYPTMTVEDIGKLPVADLADTNAQDIFDALEGLKGD